MKDGVILLNTSRGKLINPASLLRALRSEKVYAAGLDGASPEPIAPDDPLLTEPNCFITPHIAWAARESRDRLLELAADNLEAFPAGKPIHVVS